MFGRDGVNRRGFVASIAGAAGALAVTPKSFWAQARGAMAGAAGAAGAQPGRRTPEEYDLLVKLSSNENPYGPPESVLKAMNYAFKYANRYGYPDGDLQKAIAAHHGVKPENILIGAGSGEILDVVGSTFAGDGKKVVGVEPSYSQVYSHVTSLKGAAITIPLTASYDQDVQELIRITKKHYRVAGFVYLCNPNNPTGRVVPKDQIKQLLDGLPEDMPVLIDEAYHHFVDTPAYATSVPYVLEGRPVIIARTFSKIAALAGMRLGYAVAPTELIQQMRPYSTGTVNAAVKWGGVAALKDTESQAQVKRVTLELRDKTTKQLESLGYDVIPSQTNFFMVHLRRPVQPVIAEFSKKNIAVGRPFPPMTEHLRVSVGNATEMDKFVVAFKEIMANPVKTASTGH